jgi:hypothetical protein
MFAQEVRLEVDGVPEELLFECSISRLVSLGRSGRRDDATCLGLILQVSFELQRRSSYSFLFRGSQSCSSRRTLYYQEGGHTPRPMMTRYLLSLLLSVPGSAGPDLFLV